MKNTQLTPQQREFATKELVYFASQIRQEKRELEKKDLDWRMKQLAENNLAQARRMHAHYRLTLKYGNFNFEPPPVSTANWDFISWDKYLTAQGNVPL